MIPWRVLQFSALAAFVVATVWVWGEVWRTWKCDALDANTNAISSATVNA